MFRPFWIAHIDGMKILFIGIITEEVLAATKTDELIGSFVDIGEAAREVGNICNAYNAIDIDFTVLLTHIGFEEDKKLAAMLDPDWGVDVIIGGHSHTKLEEPFKVNDIYIVQAGTGTDEIGRFDIMVDTDLNAIDTFTWQMVPIDDAALSPGRGGGALHSALQERHLSEVRPHHHPSFLRADPSQAQSGNSRWATSSPTFCATASAST